MRLKRNGFFSDMVGKKLKQICICNSCKRGSLGQINPQRHNKKCPGTCSVVAAACGVHTIEMCSHWLYMRWNGRFDSWNFGFRGISIAWFSEGIFAVKIHWKHISATALLSDGSSFWAPLDQESNT